MQFVLLVHHYKKAVFYCTLLQYKFCSHLFKKSKPSFFIYLQYIHYTFYANLMGNLHLFEIYIYTLTLTLHFNTVYTCNTHLEPYSNRYVPFYDKI